MKKMRILLTVSILALLLGGCGTADSKTDQDINNISSSIKETPVPTTTPTPTISPTPLPTPIILPKENDIKNTDTIDNGYVTWDKSAILDILSINTDDPLWVLTDVGDDYRYKTLSDFFGLSIEDTKILEEAYYLLYNEDLNGNWYNPINEENAITDWVYLIEIAFECDTFDEALHFVINGYADGSLTSDKLPDGVYIDDEISDKSPVLDILDINLDESSWVTTDEGKKYRDKTLSDFFEFSLDDTKILIDSFYYLNNIDFYGDYYNPVDEEIAITGWIRNVGYEYKCKSLNDTVQFIIKGYTDGSLTPETLFSADNQDDGSYPDTDEELFEYYSDRDNTSDEISYDDNYNTDAPLSKNGVDLEIGDKVQYTSDNVFYYGGTIRVIDGSTVKVTWEMKGDLYSGLIDKLTEEDKDPISNAIFNPCNIPSDNQWYDAADMEKVSNNSW
jgi:hypothetical protein